MTDAPASLASEFPYRFLAALGNKATTIKRLRTVYAPTHPICRVACSSESNIHIAITVRRAARHPRHGEGQRSTQRFLNI